MVDETMTFERFSGVVTLFEKIVGFNSPSISQKDMLTKVNDSTHKHLIEGLSARHIDLIYIFWRRKRGSQTNSMLRQFWKRYSYEDPCAEAIFKSRSPSIVIDQKSKLRKKGGN